MQIPFFGKKPFHTVYTLLISKSTVGACAWHVDRSDIIIDSVSDLVTWDEEDEQTLFDASDSALSVLAKYPADQVLLSLPDDWVQGQGIHPKRKNLLRTLTEKLELSSVGFVVTIEALIAHLKENAHHPLNTICACVDPDAFIMAIIEQGHSSQIMRIGRSGNTTDDFLEGCSRLKLSQIPPSMTIVSLSETESALSEIKQEFESYEWDPALFIQPPAISIQSPFFVLSAVTKSGGREVSKALPELSEQMSESMTPNADFTPVESGVSEEDGEEENETVPEPVFYANQHSGGGKSKLLLVGGGVGVLALIVFIFSFFVAPILARVQVTIKRASIPLSATLPVVIDTEETTASESAHVRGTILALPISTEQEVPTTGKKLAGDKASGTVTIFNLTSSGKEFKSGTALKAGKLSFVTSEDVNVASASTGVNYEKVPGKAVVKANATAVGEESNINKNLEMIVGTYDVSAFIARSESAFSGGTSRTVQAVTAKDQETALQSATADVTKRASESLAEKISIDQDGIVLDGVSIATKKYDKNVDDEASSLSLSMTASASALIYSKTDVLTALAGKFTGALPPGVSIDDAHLTLNRLDQKKLGPKRLEVTFQVEGNVLSPVDSAQYAQILAGKNLEEVRTFLESQKSIADYSFKLSPVFVTPFVRSFPTDPQHIRVEIGQ